MKRLLVSLWLTVACSAAPAFVREMPTPAAPGSQCSNLTAAPDGTLYLTWSESGDKPGERALRLATLAPGAAGWSAPRTIVSSPRLMENWADFASLCVGRDGALTAQWFQTIPGDTGHHGYDGWFSRSTDAGTTWRAPARLGHEFVALAPLSEGRTLAIWLESARAHDSHESSHAKRAPGAPYAPSMKLRARLLAPDGGALGEWTIDPDVCTCCQTTATALPGDQVFVSYRGHTPDEIRDHCYTVFDLHSRAFSRPAKLAEDGWKIAACPVNGPAVDSRGQALAVAWFAAPDGNARVQARYSPDAGRTLGPSVRIDLGRPMGRIETVVLADASALILWMEVGTAANPAGVYARRLFAGGKLSAPQLVTTSTESRASGFPRAALRANGRVVMSWTKAGEPNRVQLCEIDPSLLVADTSGTRPLRDGRLVAIELCEPGQSGN